MYIFDDQQVRTRKGNDRVQDVISINIGTGGKDILLGADGNDLDTAGAGDPGNCDQVVARFRDADVTVFPTYFNGMCLWFLKVILAVLNLKKKTNKKYFQNHFFSWLEYRITKYKRSLHNWKGMFSNCQRFFAKQIVDLETGKICVSWTQLFYKSDTFVWYPPNIKSSR